MTDSLPSAVILHSMPGRARARIGSHRGDAAFFAAIAAGLSAHPNVVKVDVSPLTGSLLIRHRGPLAEIVSTAEAAGLFRVVSPEEAPASAPLEWPTLPIDPKLAAAAVLGMIALWQLREGKFLPPALTLLWYASALAGLRAASGPFDDAE